MKRSATPGSSPDHAIVVEGLSKMYGRSPAVTDLDLTVRAGEVFAFLGPNGAGKTTTIEILEGHRRRDSGTVSVLGEDPALAGREWRSRVGIVLQGASDSGELTVRESIRHFARYYRGAHGADYVIEICGLVEKANARVRTLSGGQRRRLDVALAIIGRPELVFLDEPTTGFDPEARRQFWDVVRTLSREGTTVLLTTHYLEEAEALADRLAVISAGRLVAQGTPANLGGRENAPTTISWIDDEGDHAIHSQEPATVLAELGSRSLEIRNLQVTRPTLEDVYLNLIGEVA